MVGQSLKGQRLNATFGESGAETHLDFAMLTAITTPLGLTGGGANVAAKALIQAEKVSGSYLLEFESGFFYAGKGLEPRMLQSINRIETQFVDKCVNSQFFPASTTKGAFINEHNLMMQFGGPKSFDKLSPTYNLIFSPGKKLGGF